MPLLQGFLDVVANILDCDIVIREFELKSRYNVNFRRNTPGNVIIYLYLWVK